MSFILCLIALGLLCSVIKLIIWLQRTSKCPSCGHGSIFHDFPGGCMAAKDETGIGGCGCRARSVR